VALNKFVNHEEILGDIKPSAVATPAAGAHAVKSSESIISIDALLMLANYHRYLGRYRDYLVSELEKDC
jgi:hypothetical protein